LQLDALEKRGYLDPDRRGNRADECDAIEMFLGDSLRSYSLNTRRRCSSRISSAMLVQESRRSSAKGAFGRMSGRIGLG
jgi:hypothetical protein